MPSFQRQFYIEKAYTGHSRLSLIQRCPYFRGVLISEVSVERGSTVQPVYLLLSLSSLSPSAIHKARSQPLLGPAVPAPPEQARAPPSHAAPEDQDGSVSGRTQERQGAVQEGRCQPCAVSIVPHLCVMAISML